MLHVLMLSEEKLIFIVDYVFLDSFFGIKLYFLSLQPFLELLALT